MNEVLTMYLITERRKIPDILKYTPEALQSLVDEASGKIQSIITIGKDDPDFFKLSIDEEQTRLEDLEGRKPSWSRLCAGYVAEKIAGDFLFGKAVRHLYGNPSGSTLFAMWFDLGHGVTGLTAGIPVTEQLIRSKESYPEEVKKYVELLGTHPSGLKLLKKRLKVYQNGLATVYGDPGVLLEGAKLGLQAYNAVYGFSEQFPLQK